jgi:[protein-PII] uridylyltransferase
VIPAAAAGDGSPVRDELERDLYAVLPTPPPAKPVEEAS